MNNDNDHDTDPANKIKFQAGKNYLTRRGNVTRVYAVDGQEPFAIHGAVEWQPGAGFELMKWRHDGRYFEFMGSENDLMPHTKTVRAWVVVWYAETTSEPYMLSHAYMKESDAIEAKRAVGIRRIKTIPITYEVEE